MSVLGKFTKQPRDVLDYDIDFNEWLEGRTDLPESHEVDVPSGINLVRSTLQDGVVKVILSGGATGVKYKVTVRLLTDTQLVKEVDFELAVKEF